MMKIGVVLFVCVFYCTPLAYSFNRCVDQAGKLVFTDRPCAEQFLQQVESATRPAESNALPPVASPSPGRSSRVGTSPQPALSEQESALEVSKRMQEQLAGDVKRPPEHAPADEIDPIEARLSALSDASEKLLGTFSQSDRSRFRGGFLPTLEEFTAQAKQPRWTEEQLRQRYELTLDWYEKDWEKIRADGVRFGINWPDVEFLSSSGMSSPGYGKQWLSFRANRKNYVIPVQYSLKNDRWLVTTLGELSLASAVVKKQELTAKPLHEVWAFATEPPAEGFKAIYFNVKSGQVGCTDQVDEINVHLGEINQRQFGRKSSPFCGIPERDLGAYFVGAVPFEAAAEKALSVRFTHWAKVQVDIDEQPVFTNRAGKRSYSFGKGPHKIEALYQPYLNGLHWAEFGFAIADQRVPYSRKELQQALRGLPVKDVELWYAGVYESASYTDSPIRIKLEDSARPVILLLTAVDARRFIIDNAARARLQAIVFSGDLTSTVSFSDGNVAPVYGLLWQHSIPWSKQLHEPIRGESDPLLLLKSIEAIFPGGKLSGFSCAYDTALLEVPKERLSGAEYRELRTRLGGATGER